VVIIEERKYLIGAQLAKVLKRETFNLYRSMRIKGIELLRAVGEPFADDDPVRHVMQDRA